MCGRFHSSSRSPSFISDIAHSTAYIPSLSTSSSLSLLLLSYLFLSNSFSLLHSLSLSRFSSLRSAVHASSAFCLCLSCFSLYCTVWSVSSAANQWMTACEGVSTRFDAIPLATPCTAIFFRALHVTLLWSRRIRCAPRSCSALSTF